MDSLRRIISNHPLQSQSTIPVTVALCTIKMTTVQPYKLIVPGKRLVVIHSREVHDDDRPCYPFICFLILPAHTLFLHILLLFIKTIVHNRNLAGEVTKHSWDTYGRPA